MSNLQELFSYDLVYKIQKDSEKRSIDYTRNFCNPKYDDECFMENNCLNSSNSSI